MIKKYLKWSILKFCYFKICGWQGGTYVCQQIQVYEGSLRQEWSTWSEISRAYEIASIIIYNSIIVCHANVCLQSSSQDWSLINCLVLSIMHAVLMVWLFAWFTAGYQLVLIGYVGFVFPSIDIYRSVSTVKTAVCRQNAGEQFAFPLHTFVGTVDKFVKYWWTVCFPIHFW